MNKYISIAVWALYLSIAIFFLTINTAGCKSTSEKTIKINQYEVEFLFEIDKCKMYRFYDAGRNHYFLTAPGETSASWNDGDNNRTENIQTKKIK
jgi:hypothetical protein